MTYEEAMTAIPAGLYRHFKGNYYKVLKVVRHSETMEPMVVYQALYGDSGVWVRPAEMWNGTVERDGNVFRRFTRLTREERIAFYEHIFDELNAVLNHEEQWTEDFQNKYLLLDAYYSSGEWQEDYEADEAGQILADLSRDASGVKRGVLSQDGVYDLLTEWQENLAGGKDGSENN